MNYKCDYLFIGAGLFNCTLAYLVNKKGYNCIIVDDRDYIGGLCHDTNLYGINVHDHGPHIFHTNSEVVWKFVNRLVPMIPYKNTPVAFYKGNYYNLPINLNTFKQIYGQHIESKDIDSLINNDIKLYKEPNNIEEKMLSSIGSKLYETLIKHYTEKAWGKSCKELPIEIINRIPIRYYADNNYYNDLFQGVPVTSYNSLFKTLTNDIKVLKNYHWYPDDPSIEYNHVFYSGAVDEFFKFSLGELEYRSRRFTKEYHKDARALDFPIINYTDNITPYLRAIEYKFIGESSILDHSVIQFEYPLDYKSGRERYYPVPTEKNLRLYKEYIKNKPDWVTFTGRLGLYQYLDMDDAIELAMKMANSYEEKRD